MSQSEAVPGSRLLWADAARGASVLLVVLFHVILWHLSQYQSAMWVPADRIWSKFNDVLGSVRIPLLLGVAGLVGSRRILRGFSDRRNLVRAASNYYLYVVWLLIYALYFAFVSDPALPHRIDGLRDVTLQLVLPDTTLWFVYALGLYIIALSAMHRIPGWLQILVLAFVCLIARSLDIDGRQTLKIAENAFFFGVGVHAAPWLRRLGERASLLRFLVSALVAVIVTLSGRVMIGDVLGSVLFMVRGVAFMIVAVLGTAMLIKWRPAGVALAAVGRQTLPIYVLHPLMITSIIALTSWGSVASKVLGTPVGALLYPLALVAVIAVASLALHRALLRARLGLLFEMPARWRSLLLADRPAIPPRTAE